jgi:hypothetical protein
MDETSLRVQLELALSAEPPLGNLVDHSVRAGRKLRRRRRAGAAALSAAAVVAVSAVPALVSDGGHEVSKTGRITAPLPAARTAYVATGADTVVPISLATNTVGTPIKVPVKMTIGGLGTSQAVATPDGRTVYEYGVIDDTGLQAAVVPIDVSTDTAGPMIAAPAGDPSNIAVDPNGRTAYLSFDNGVCAIDIATGAASKLISIPARAWAMAFTPDGQMVYVVDDPGGVGQTLGVTPIRTATNTALRPIKLPVSENTSGYLYDIAITPNGKTAYVVDGVQQGKPYANAVIPIDLAINRALAPIKIEASGLASGLVVTPDGRTAYVLSSRAVTPIDTATNQAERAISLPESAGYAYRIVMSPDGRTMYVLTPRGVIPIRTASGTVLPMIRVPKLFSYTLLAVTPDGRTVYVLTSTGVVPISTTTNTAGKLINLGAQPTAITFAG